MRYETLKYERQDFVGILRIDRPQAMNALNRQVIEELDDFLSHLEPDVRCLIVTGSGEKAFVAGADIKEMENYGPTEALGMSQKGQSVLKKLEDLPCAVIAAVNGYALGGGLELALACDFIIASETAKFGLPEVSLGLIPGYGGTQRLARCVGKAVARYIIFSGEMCSAKQAENWGLVVKVVPAAELMKVGLQVAQVVASRAPLAVGLAKKAINEGFEQELASALNLEAEAFAKTFSTKDKEEGVKAFIEKRRPQFTGQ